jgi:addiction module HigA family antidote
MMMNPSHPGEILREDVVEALGISVTEAAKRLGMSRVAFSRVLNCKAAISPELAVRLEIAGVSTARAWLAMQVNYDLAQVREKPQPQIQSLRGDLKSFTTVDTLMADLNADD